MNHSSTLEFSSRLPVSVYGTGINNLCLEGFLGNMIRIIIRLSEDSRYCPPSARSADLPTVLIPTEFNVLFRQYADLSLFRRPIAVIDSIRILTDCPSTTPFGFALGPD